MIKARCGRIPTDTLKHHQFKAEANLLNPYLFSNIFFQDFSPQGNHFALKPKTAFSKTSRLNKSRTKRSNQTWSTPIFDLIQGTVTPKATPKGIKFDFPE